MHFSKAFGDAWTTISVEYLHRFRNMREQSICFVFDVPHIYHFLTLGLSYKNTP